MSMTEVKTGWGWPINARKAHFYVDSFSLCKKWTLFGGQVENGNDDSPDNCKTCKKELDRLKERQRKAAEMVQFEITVNGEGKTVEGREHGYEEIVKLAGFNPERILTVTFTRAANGKQGSLTPGQKTVIAAGTVFNVADTSNA